MKSVKDPESISARASQSLTRTLTMTGIGNTFWSLRIRIPPRETPFAVSGVSLRVLGGGLEEEREFRGGVAVDVREVAASVTRALASGSAVLRDRDKLELLARLGWNNNGKRDCSRRASALRARHNGARKVLDTGGARTAVEVVDRHAVVRTAAVRVRAPVEWSARLARRGVVVICCVGARCCEEVVPGPAELCELGEPLWVDDELGVLADHRPVRTRPLGVGEDGVLIA